MSIFAKPTSLKNTKALMYCHISSLMAVLMLYSDIWKSLSFVFAVLPILTEENVKNMKEEIAKSR